jgi:hypothetical protein
MDVNGAELENGFVREIEAQIIKALNKTITGTREKLKDLIGEALTNSPEYRALENGQFYAEIGLVNILSVVDKIIKRLARSAEITVNRAKIADLTVKIIKSDYSDLLSIPEASFPSENGFIVDWLRWLLLEGTSPVVIGYSFLGVPAKKSRTGQGIMIHSKGNWNVPYEFSGTQDDNWITRSLSADFFTENLEKLIVGNFINASVS